MRPVSSRKTDIQAAAFCFWASNAFDVRKTKSKTFANNDDELAFPGFFCSFEEVSVVGHE